MNKRIAILGAGESGVGAAILAKQQGFAPFVSDCSLISPHYKAELVDHDILWEEGQHSENKILNAHEVVKSPGIPNTVPIIQKLIRRGTPVISEIEFAARYTSAKMIAITGSNGKTTTTSLLHHLFVTAKKSVGLAGNIGLSLARQVASAKKDYYIIELSSFQLDNMYQFKAHIALLLNITPDHLDRYNNSMEEYIRAKFRITQNQTKSDFLIYGAEDPNILSHIERENKGEAIKLSFGLKRESNFAYTTTQNLCIDSNPRIEIDRSTLHIKGEHNIYNALAAISAAFLVDIDKDCLIKGLSSFKGVEHRLEYVSLVNGVKYINDSKATNVDSCWYALQSIETKIVLILGGKDKGNDYTKIEEIIKSKCSGLVLLGKDNTILLNFFSNYNIPIIETHSMNDAVESASKLAKKGETVLLSPCCASFDLFNSYEHRGNLFKQAVKEL